MRCRWLSLCTVWPSHSQISSLSPAILALVKARSRREPNLDCSGADRSGWCYALQKRKSLHEGFRMGRCIVMMKLICSLGHCECDGHTAQKLSQRRLTADWLAPWESDCSRMRSKVSSDWLPSYIKATGPVIEIFKMSGYFTDGPCIYIVHKLSCWSRVGDPCYKQFPVTQWKKYDPSVYSFYYSKRDSGYMIRLREVPLSGCGIQKYTVVRRLTTEIRSEKCVVMRFRRCANVI